ncbi:MAG: hypothetical protein M3Z16_10465 [Pseudomonadota bacterium]|nr:hypothetical protein [Pseudomonadota bacterium]
MSLYASSTAALHALRPWATASEPTSADTTPLELSALSDHVDTCYGSRGRLFALRCAVDSVQQFLAPRLITTLVVIACLIGVVTFVV